MQNRNTEVFGQPEHAAMPTSQVTLYAGAPGSGKTQTLFNIMSEQCRALGDDCVVMTVANRQIADTLSDQLIRELGVSSQARPITTLNAIAFRLLTAQRMRENRPLPRLINGAEQDLLLRKVLARHIAEAEAGDTCETCRQLRAYFEQDHWERVISSPVITETTPKSGLKIAPKSTPKNVSSDSVDEASALTLPAETTTDLLVEGIDGEFIDQLRDMLTRMAEIGLTSEQEPTYLENVANSGLMGQRLRTQWQLAFSLRHEYKTLVQATFKSEYRLDAAELLSEAAQLVSSSDHFEALDELIVDDVQDLTLSGLSFLKALAAQGVTLVLAGNPDEAVQTFRGSYPEYVFRILRDELGAQMVPIDAHFDATLLNTIASRVSLSIAAIEPTDQAMPDRPGKMPIMDGAWPIHTLDDQDNRLTDGTMRGMVYRSDREQEDGVVWRIKSLHLNQKQPVAWNDMAVIMHDNAAIRALGARLRRDGVPVRYSSVTRPLIEEPFVQGLFAIIELAQMRQRGIAHSGMTPRQAAGWVRSRVRMIADSPLIDAASDTNSSLHMSRPLRLESIESAMRALDSLSTVIASEDSESEQSSSVLTSLQQDWTDLAAQFNEVQQNTVDSSQLSIDNSNFEEATGNEKELGLGIDAMMLMLMHNGAPQLLDMLGLMLGQTRQYQAFQRLWRIIDTVANRMQRDTEHTAVSALEIAWLATGVANRWQTASFTNNAAGRAANDRLDVAMRLFEYARGASEDASISAFIDQVRQLQIEADSLAQVAPIDQAVTLTTPAGAAGRHWAYVFMPGVQESVWPNLAARSTMFGGEELVRMALYGVATQQPDALDWSNESSREVLANEQKSFLVGLTRVDTTQPQFGLWMSAVASEETVPSEFLYGYCSEWFDREEPYALPLRRLADLHDDTDVAQAAWSDLHTLDEDTRGIIALARIELAKQNASMQDESVKDAAMALAQLALGGVHAADPKNWPYVVNREVKEQTVAETEQSAADVQTAETPTYELQFSEVVAEDGTKLVETTGARSAQQETQQADQQRTKHRNTVHKHVSDAIQPAQPETMTVMLSPSQVDSYWDCPICAKLDKVYSGPQRGSLNQSFGVIIHAVAAFATEHQYDMPNTSIPGLDESAGTEARIAALTDIMMAEFTRLVAEQPELEEGSDQYAAQQDMLRAHDVLRSIANYFVLSTTEQYKSYEECPVLGELESAQAEVPFQALFNLRDVLAAYNAMPSVDAIDEPTLLAIMEQLVGGWPGYSPEGLNVRLTGRIDRQEWRKQGNGSEVLRIIDYKTGVSHTGPEQYQDLQLVCYQLGYAFPQPEHGHRKYSLAHMPVISQCDLFYAGVDDKGHVQYPAQSHYRENVAQPALFVNGALNADAYRQRPYFKEISKLFNIELPEEAPAGVDEHAWQQLLELRGTNAIWSLTMIARVFYAAAASVSTTLTAHPTAGHMNHCQNDVKHTICPACGQGTDTVFETRRA
ncbi:PD-(D/E)XK nuclease family protein [Bifidobacterium dolichotidis]|nr:PD-(D/E)XK nuclease family protein [Bifidobacterium dolichotidis]